MTDSGTQPSLSQDHISSTSNDSDRPVEHSKTLNTPSKLENGRISGELNFASSPSGDKNEEVDEREVERPTLESLSMNCYGGSCVVYGQSSLIISLQKELSLRCTNCFSWSRMRADPNFPPLKSFDVKSVTFKPTLSSKLHADRMLRSVIIDTLLGLGYRIEEFSMLSDEYEYIFVKLAHSSIGR